MSTIPSVGSERATQNRVVAALRKHCRYQYLGYKQDTDNQPLIPEILVGFIRDTQQASPAETDKVLRLLEREVNRCHDKDSLYQSNLNFYNYLRYGVNIQGDDGRSKTVAVVDWNVPANNVFSIAEEVTVRRNIEDSHTRRPDIVVYVNGMALGVIELKSSTVSVGDGIRQQIRNNQNDNEICHFFVPSQFLFAGNDSEGLYYGTILTPEKFWLRRKEPAGESYPCDTGRPEPAGELFPRAQFPNELERSLLQMLEPERLLRLIHDCVVFDGGVKKVCRPNQYFAFEAAKPRIRNKQSGIIWHSQGAGKSLLMVWLAQWILENMPDDPRVVIITDREELDRQIENGFKDAGHNPVRATSGANLLAMLADTSPRLICTLINKFGIVRHAKNTGPSWASELGVKRSPEQYMAALAAQLPAGFKAKGNIYVFVDECHRSQNGVLNLAMKKIMGDDVMLIGFTGTPLLRHQKNRLTSRHNFGNYIHTYKFNEAVEDGVILDLRYEAREVEQNLEDEQAVDRLFEYITRNLGPRAKAALQSRWAVMKNLFSSRDRVHKIVADITKDMLLIPCLRDGWGNAMLVCDSVYQAFRYWEAFQGTHLNGHCAVVSSFDGKEASPEESSAGETQSEAEYKAEKARQMFRDRSPEEFERWARSSFVDRPADMKLLIVVSKLLTGFDAPSATYIYLDKGMKDQELFQAVCRVNRTDNDHENKEYGYIVDYKQLFKSIERAVGDYTGGAFAEFDEKDVKGLLTDRFRKAAADLDAALERVEQLCDPVAQPKSIDEFFDYFVFDRRTTPPDDEEAATIRSAPQREAFYNAVRILVIRFSAIALDMDRAGYSAEQMQDIAARVGNLDKIRRAVMLRAGDIIDMKQYDQQMRGILDDYVDAKPSASLAALEDLSILDLVLDGNSEATERDAAGELGGADGVTTAITANVRRVINRRRNRNPEEYRRFSERLNRLLADYRQGVLDYKEYLEAMARLNSELRGRSSDPRLNTPGKRALYDNLGEDVELALQVDEIIHKSAKQGFRTNEVKTAKLRKALERYAAVRPFDVDAVMQLVIYQHEY